MLKYIKSTTFPNTGSGVNSDTRKGIVPFGRGDRSNIYVGDGHADTRYNGQPYKVSLETAKVTYDITSGTVNTYLNIWVEEIVSGGRRHCKEYFGYTAQEAEQLLQTLCSMSVEELNNSIPVPSYYNK